MNPYDETDRESTGPESVEEVIDKQSVESEAKTVEEAVELALQQLEVDREQVDVEILAEPRSGLFGLGSAQARVRVTVRETGADPFDIVTDLIELMGIDASITRSDDDEEVYLSIESEDAALLIGQRGRCLNSLQFLVNRIAGRRQRFNKRIVVDVAGYRDRRRESLTATAERQAEKAKRTGREVRLQPLDPQDRRAVHLALKDDPDVETYSVGEGLYRTLVISPEEGSGRSGGPGSRDRH